MGVGELVVGFDAQVRFHTGSRLHRRCRYGWGDAGEAARRLKAVLDGFDHDAEIFIERVEAGNISSVSSTIKRLIDEHRSAGHHIAIDVTSGTKDLVLGSMINDLDKVEHVFYLRIDSLWNADRPYVMIPVERQRLIDVLEEVR